MRKNLRAIIAIEFENMVYFPILEGIICLLVFFCFSALTASFAQDFEIITGSVYNGTTIETDILEDIQRLNIQQAVNPLQALSVAYFFFVPLLSTLTITRPIEDGTLRAYLSFPVSRSSILMVKFLLVNLILWVTSTGSWIMVVALLLPGYQQYLSLIVWSLVLLLNCMVITSTCFLISMLSKQSGTSLFIGLGLWYVLTVLASSYNTPIQLRGLFFPAIIVWLSVQYGSSYVLTGELILPILGAIAIVILAYSACHIVFKKMEV